MTCLPEAGAVPGRFTLPSGARPPCGQPGFWEKPGGSSSRDPWDGGTNAPPPLGTSGRAVPLGQRLSGGGGPSRAPGSSAITADPPVL